MPRTFQINAVAFQEGDGSWVIQGIERDIVAYCHDVTELPHVFTRAVLENAIITEHLGRKPLEGIKPAPAKYREMFEQARTVVTAADFDGDDHPIKPKVSVRLAQATA